MWPAFRQLLPDNQRKDKRVESRRVRRLDSGSSPLTSTIIADNQQVNTLTQKLTQKNAQVSAYFLYLYSKRFLYSVPWSLGGSNRFVLIDTVTGYRSQSQDYSTIIFAR